VLCAPCSMCHADHDWQIRWRYVSDDFQSGPLWMPSDLFGGLDLARRPLELHVDGLPLRHFTGQARDTYLRAIPVDVLVSLSMAHPTPPLTTRLASLKRLLLESRHLLTFHYRDRGQGTYFTFAGNERFPAFKELSLKSYDWNHDVSTFRQHWDFSRLRSLELSSVPLFNFLSSVPASELADLHTLRVEDFSAHLPDQRREASRRLSGLVKNHVRALRTFEATCNIDEFRIDAIIKHATSLRHLRLNDHIGFGEDDRYCPTLAIEDVRLLAECCGRLQTLELDLDARTTNVTAFLRNICVFPALHTLTLHVPSAIDTTADADSDTQDGEANQQVAQRMFDFLMREKAPKASHSNEEQPSAVWQSVTINLGGWRTVMIRRLSEAWQQRNRMGIFAEQCFVWRRDEEGQMKMEELAAVEAQAE
jgi:hypothetical protein